MQVPSGGAAREALRVNGQFWTPDWVADAMVAYALRDGADTLFDPGVGAGSFLRAGRRLVGNKLRFRGQEIDEAALSAAVEAGMSADDLAGIELRDFALFPPHEKFNAIVANPPYVRHHRLNESTKLRLHAFARTFLGHSVDGRAGLHVFFFLRCLELLSPNGRLAFIVSADICEGVFARSMWAWIAERYCLDAVVTFDPEATPFPGVDTNAVLFLIRRSKPASIFKWVRVTNQGQSALASWVEGGLTTKPSDRLMITSRPIKEGLSTGFSRAPIQNNDSRYCLGDFARVMRGVASGHNDFFFMTRKRARELDLPLRHFVPALGRMRDVRSDTFTLQDLDNLEASGRPTLLLALGDEPLDKLPAAVQRYIESGEKSGINQRTLIATRNPWYRMEKRNPPPFFFAYLGRRAIRFIRNKTSAVPLTCLLCVYPHDPSATYTELLHKVLTDPRTLANLRLVGKSYGDGALKVEPRALQRLPIPDDVLKEVGLIPRQHHQQAELALL